MNAPLRQDFTSDNITGAAPEVFAALAAANAGTVASYGADPLSEALTERASELFERPVAILPVATGTAANALALSLLARPFEAVYCHAAAHVMTDECGAPEFYSGGAKLIGLPSCDGRLAPQQLAEAVGFARSMGVHHVQPAAVSVSQATEWGTVYGLAELGRLAASAHELGLRVHMDGARFANALASLGCSPAEASWRAGVDVLSLGASKNGALAAEAVVLFEPALAAELALRRKRSGHLWSKMRFLSAQLLAYLDGGLWLRHARQANAMAQRLAAGLGALAGARLVQPVEANELFIALPPKVTAGLRAAGYRFYDWPAPPGAEGAVARLVAAYDVRPQDVDALIAAARRVSG
ncbi:MAG TPA: beta-eliminating lyase-related protein [Steroidobacteraceae bacterium]|nr:beta-eliminating lyase-related protein [Steroidobacteraceae bacterium]